MPSAFVSDLFSLDGKTAVVTGAARGIGSAIARALAFAGAAVVVADLDGGSASAVARDIERGGAHAVGCRCDVSTVADLDALVSLAVSKYGRVDVLVNNAGVFPVQPALELTEESWDRVLGINLRGAFFLSQRVAREMIREKHGGAIVNITSIDALHPNGQLAHYDASKGGLQMLTRSLALEFGRFGIRVNAVAPGAIKTPGADVAMAAMVPGGDASKVTEAFVARIALRRMGEPDDIARAVLFLAGQGASYVTGSTLVVDGGFLLS